MTLPLPILYDAWHTQGGVGWGVVYFPNSRATLLQQCGQCTRPGRMKRRLIRAHTTRSKTLSCKGQVSYHWRHPPAKVGSRSQTRSNISRGRCIGRLVSKGRYRGGYEYIIYMHMYIYNRTTGAIPRRRSGHVARRAPPPPATSARRSPRPPKATWNQG